VVATATGKRSATINFAAPSSNGGSPIISYTVTSTSYPDSLGLRRAVISVGEFTQTLEQSTGGTFTFNNLQPGTTYTFSVVATNVIGPSTNETSNSITTTALDVASITSLSFVDDGSGIGGKLLWSGRNISSVLYTGPTDSYPGPYNYGVSTSAWNGRLSNLLPETSYTISISAMSADGIGETKSLTFKTSAASSMPSPTSQNSTNKIELALKWVTDNTFTPGEESRIAQLLKRFNALKTFKNLTHIRVPTSRVSKVQAISLTPSACSVGSATSKFEAGMVRALSGETCTISYTVSDRSKVPVTMVRDFVFRKFAK
jgi:hypothetical protein